MGYSPWGCKEWDTTEQLHFSFLNILLLRRTEVSVFCSLLSLFTAQLPLFGTTHIISLGCGFSKIAVFSTGVVHIFNIHIW